jgi:hypothetical protein
MVTVTRQRTTKKKTAKKPANAKAKRTKRSNNNHQSQSILDSIVPVSELPDTGLRIGIYGRSGTGKTTLASDFAKLGPALLVRANEGTKSVRKVKNLFATKILESAQDLTDIVEQVGTDYTTLILDEVTTYQDLVLCDVMDWTQVPSQLAWGDVAQSNWQEVGQQMKARLRDLLNLTLQGVNVILLAQERAFEASEEDDILIPYVMFAASPSVATWIAREVDYAVQTYVQITEKTKLVKVAGRAKPIRKRMEVPEFCLRTGPHPVFYSKFRKDKEQVLPEHIVDPTCEKIQSIIDGSYDPNPKKKRKA